MREFTALIFKISSANGWRDKTSFLSDDFRWKYEGLEVCKKSTGKEKNTFKSRYLTFPNAIRQMNATLRFIDIPISETFVHHKSNLEVENDPLEKKCTHSHVYIKSGNYSTCF